jgi:protein phosphatase
VQTEAEAVRRGRRLGILVIVIAAVTLPILTGAYIASQAVYFIGTDDEGFITVYRGVPYDLPAGIKLYATNYVSGVPAGAVAPRRRARLLDHTLRSRKDAADLVRQLERGRLSS